MGDRPVVVPHFGAYLTKHRESRGLKPAQVERLVTEKYGLPLAHTVLWRWEEGQVASPDPAILWALSRVYRISSDEMIGCLAKERSHRPIAQSDLATPGITDRSAGISDEALAMARAIDALPPDLVLHVIGQLELLKETARRYGRARPLPVHRPRKQKLKKDAK